METTSEVLEFNEKFDKEIQKVTIVTGASGFSGSNWGEMKLWNACIGITAWKLTDSDRIFKGKYFLYSKADDEYLKELRKIILPNSIISLKVRQNGNDFLFVEIIENKETDKEMEAILAEQTKPVIYNDKILGEFTLDKRIDLYVGEIKWLGENIELDIENYTGKRLDKVFVIANELVKEEKIWDKKIKEFAAKKLLKLKNENWLEEAEKEITIEQFIEKIEINSINISLKNNFEFYLDDGDVFWGHTIVVNGNIEKGPLRANIAG